jgi:hypothetical protein
MIKSLTTLLAPYDIRANFIAPGFYLSELSENAFRKLGVEGDGTKKAVSSSSCPGKPGWRRGGHGGCDSLSL